MRINPSIQTNKILWVERNCKQKRHHRLEHPGLEGCNVEQHHTARHFFFSVIVLLVAVVFTVVVKNAEFFCASSVLFGKLNRFRGSSSDGMGVVALIIQPQQSHVDPLENAKLC